MKSHTDGSGSVVIGGNRFRLVDVIYQGSDSRICSASSDESGSDSAFVIKCVTCRRESDAWHSAMREIEAGEMLRRCPNVAGHHGYSVIDAGGGLYHVFLLFDRRECADGMTLDETGCALMCRDICLALEALRKKGLVHGDVKPANIYRSGDRWLLGDLGSVFLSGQSPEYRTEGYCSPEAMRGERCDIRSDVYSLGVTAYRMLCGRLPLCGLTCGEAENGDVRNAIERRMRGESFVFPDGISPGFSAILTSMCRVERSERPRTPGCIARDIKKIIH